MMFSLQKLLGKEDRFFNLLEASVEEAQISVQTFVRMTKARDREAFLGEFAESRRKVKRITEEISEALVTTFVTALEREDIEALSNALYRIPKTVEKFAEHFLVAQKYARDIDFSRQGNLLEQAVGILVEMMKRLHQLSQLQEIKNLNLQLQKLEGDADKLMLDLLRGLYNGNDEPIKVIALRDLYELLEKVIDRCRDAGNVISQIVLKNS